MYAYLDQISTLHYMITYILFQKSFFLQPKNVLLEYCPTSFFLQKSQIGSSTYKKPQKWFNSCYYIPTYQGIYV